MAWLCPECSGLNQDNSVRCLCGHERAAGNDSDYIFVSDAQRDEGLKLRAGRQPRDLKLEFRGSAGEYFRIWIVNLCLTLLTFGIFSAWAKVRKKRYFYSHTILDGTPFQYLGRPVPILKGRVVAALAFLTYQVSAGFFTSFLPYIIIAGMVLAPWVVIRSAAFNARYSAFRNMTFHFDGKYPEALKVLSMWGIVPALVIGITLDWSGNIAAAGLLAVIMGIGFPWWIRRVKDFIIRHSSFGRKHGAFYARGGQFFGVYFTGGLIVAGAGVAAVMLAGLLVVSIKENNDLFIFTLVPVYAAYVLGFAYVQAHSTNLVWNNTRLGSLSFQSVLTGKGMAKLYLTNALAIIFSIGLLIPWAVMRTLKYRADHMRVVLGGDLNEFQSSDTDTVKAAGSEMGDFFGMDFSL
jgi:uncharacterized membrane protein YjgN (DUF898 family)